MSASLWDWSLASAGNLLTTEECAVLLDVDLLNDDYDLLKTLPAPAAPACPAAPASPASPSYGEDASLYPPSPAESKPSRSELAHDLLLSLETQQSLFKQENLFSPWLEEKSDLPLFAAPVAVAVPYPAYPAHPAHPSYPAPHTDELLREFETVYGHVELTHLTPPQSPPAPLTPAAPAPAPAPAPAWQELLPASPATPSPASSPRSSDSDWSSHSRPDRRDSDWSSHSRPDRRDSDWSSHSRPDRHSRKKEQNKNAATRYRQKKKQEVEVLLSEESALRVRRDELDSKCVDIQREVRYLKGLMRDLFKAKGLIK